MAGRDHYDITPRNREILEFRASRRNALRQEFLKETMNPHRHASGIGGTIFDEQLQRLFSLEAKRSEYMRATGRNFLQYSALIIFPIVATIFIAHKVRSMEYSWIFCLCHYRIARRTIYEQAKSATKTEATNLYKS